MRSINKVIIIGNLTRDPELRQTPNGQSVTTFGIATNRAWTTQENEKKSSAEFHECVAWAHLAEICSKYLKKGNLVYVEGYLKTRNWETEEGIKKFKTEIVVQDMIMLEKKQHDGEYNPEEGKSIMNEGSTTEETPTEEVEESTVEETPVEETPVEETPAEEETPAAETPDEEKENPIDKDLGL